MTHHRPTSLALAIIVAALVIPASGARAELPCVWLVPTDNGEVLVNRCSSCREATVERRRLGQGTPTIRGLQLAGTSTMASPFRGPGQSRLLGDRACPSALVPSPGQTFLSQ